MPVGMHASSHQLFKSRTFLLTNCIPLFLLTFQLLCRCCFFILNVLDHSMRHPLFQGPRSLALPIQDQEQVPHPPSGAQPLLPGQHQRMAGRVSSGSIHSILEAADYTGRDSACVCLYRLHSRDIQVFLLCKLSH